MASYYYQYDFISPSQLYAQVKEELRSYFESGMVDDTMFPIWVKKCMDKLGPATHPIYPAFLSIVNYEARLPDDYFAMREAWACTEWNKDYQLPSASYQQVQSCATTTAMNLNPGDIVCDKCDACSSPDIMRAVYKVTDTILFHFKRETLLTPGNINSKTNSGLPYALNAATCSTYEVRGNKFTVEFPTGTVNILYYSNGVDENEDIQVPDNFRVTEFILAFLKQKIFEQIFNQTSDETYNQAFNKWKIYKAEADQAFIMAELDMKKEDIYKKQRNTERTLNRYRRFNLR